MFEELLIGSLAAKGIGILDEEENIELNEDDLDIEIFE